MRTGRLHGSGQARVRTPAVRDGSAGRRWIGLEEASRLLGVSATTVRRWSDAGMVETFVTPGGHRRFDADSVRKLLPGRGGRPTMERLGETPERISRAYRRASERNALPWIGALDEGQRNAFREHGQAIARELLARLDAPTESDRAAHLAVASAAAAEYGVAAASRGVTPAATVQTFLQFRRPFLLELVSVARRRGLDVTATTDLVGRASDAVDELLVATMRGYEEAKSGSAQPLTARPERDHPLELPQSAGTPMGGRPPAGNPETP
jgi:excisionase family DNA binding protein